MEEINKKYKQTCNTPCIMLPLRRLLGFDGNTPMGRDILQGNFDAPEETLQYTREFFRHLKYAELRTSKPKAIVSSEDFRNGWKQMKESTSAGISGLHFGHMINLEIIKADKNYNAVQ